ncbi:hypothetical protein Y032_0132g1716 [Ancylostoma ceylanicum]|uniref:Uncharacterized protein n=1 Tax=Ancylostoma ceylanicum TaxID=53326 RepID=A0A016T5Q9_9BILA|nr:hypothetical protein Y032_0132g1716 [Ancylostoma ceylanicum]
MGTKHQRRLIGDLRMKFLVLLALVPLTVQNPLYDVEPSGYGNNNPQEVLSAARKSPHNKPVDYTSTGSVVHPPKQVYQGAGKTGGYKAPHDEPAYSAILVPNNMFGNNFFAQTLGQANIQGQQNLQKGGDQTNVGANSNLVKIGQTNTQLGAGSYQPSYDAPTYTAYIFPRTDVIGNRIDAQTLAQINNQGQANVQQGGQQTNFGSNTNAVNVGQTNNQGTGVAPSYDSAGRCLLLGFLCKKEEKQQPVIVNNYIYVTQAATQGVNTPTAASGAPAATGTTTTA